MKKLFILIMLFTNTFLFAQEVGEIINMFGISDSAGKYYLIYEDVISIWNYPEGKKINFIDINKNIDSVIVKEDGWWQHDFGVNTIQCYSFFNNEPKNIIYAQNRGMAGPVNIFNYVKETSIFLEAWGAKKIIINQSKPSLVHLTTDNPNGFSTSNDSGQTWQVIDTTTDDYRPITIPFKLLSLYTNTDSTMFGIDSLGNLLKSYDAGLTSEIVEESGNWNFLHENFYYDKDGQHIYAVTKNGDHYFLYGSDNYGNKGSWNLLENSLSKISLSVDNKVSSKSYFSTRNIIYQSTDFGQTFEIVHELDYNIVGLFNVPNTDTIYAATKFAIWQIVADSIVPIKQVIARESLSFYPLHIGDKWYYDVKYLPSWSTSEFNYNLTKEIIKDTVLSNNKTYYKIKELRSDTNLVKYSFERIDSLNGKIYKYHEFVNSKEFVLFDLIAESNRPIHTINEFYDQPTSQIMYLTETGYEVFDQQLKSHRYRFYSANSINNSYGVSHKLNESIGRSYFEKYFIDGFDEYHHLKAAYINGVKYGETTLVGIDDEQISQIPTNFSLSQNYPNPFNPTTIIEYTVPSQSVISNPLVGERSQDSEFSPSGRNDNISVKLIVYDILGREVKTLVNQPQNPGKYSVQFNAENLSSGIYYYKLQFNNFFETKKMIVLK